MKTAKSLLAIGLLCSLNPLAFAGITDGLVGYYGFEGNANNSVGGQHGTTFGNVTYGAGIVGQSAVFDGVSGRIEIANEEALLGANPDAWSVAFWVLDNSPERYTNYVSDYHGVPGHDERFGFAFINDNDPVAQTVLAVRNIKRDDEIALFEPTQMIAGEWRHFAMSASKTDGLVNFYVNGLLTGQDSLTAGIDYIDSDPIHIANNYINGGVNNDWLNGNIDELRFYNRALTTSDVSELAGISVPEPLNLLVMIFGLVLLCKTSFQRCNS